MWPFTATCKLEIGGEPVTDLHRYQLLFTREGSEYRPILYQDGRRIVKNYKITVTAEVSADPYGDNANTAGG